MSENNTIFEKLSCNDRYGQEFKEEVLLGYGSFGQVYKVLHLKEKQYYAIKKIDFNEHHFDKTPEKFKDECSNEIRLMKTLKEDYVVNYIRSWSEYEDTFYIQMELCETHLNDVLQKLKVEYKRNPFQITSSIKYYISSELFNEILEALNYLHSQNPPIIHRDLKPDNILITNGLNGRFVKLTDFGLTVIHNFKDQSQTQDRRTIAYMAPEVKDSRKYNIKADIYSLGLIARQLFDLCSNISIDDLLLTEKYKSAQNLIINMTSEEKEKRLMCQQILDNEKLWYFNIEILNKDSNYKNIIESKLDQPMKDSFLKYFIRTKHSKRTDEAINESLRSSNQTETLKSFPQKEIGKLRFSSELFDMPQVRSQNVEMVLPNIDVHSGDEPINMSVAAISGIGHNVYTNEMNVIGMKFTQEMPLPPAERLPKQGWQVPPRNPHFIGRKKLLKQIADHFSEDNVPVILTTTHGLGGIGKTQLAIEFVWQHYQQYKGVAWFNAESRDQLLAGYIRLGLALSILHQDDKDAIEDRALRVKHWLEDPKCAGWLLIYDNAPKYGGTDQEGVGDLFPTKGGKLLVTSRYATGWPQGDIKVNVFKPKESRAYIEKVLSDKALDVSQVNQLAEILGHLPLALAQACAYIKKNTICITRYLELYETRKKELLSNKTLSNQTLPPDAHRAIVYITWDITMEAVRKESLLADRWLTICAYLNSNDIPNFLLEAFAGSAENNPNSEIFESALGTLGSYSMLTVDEKNCNASIHNLVQEVIQLQSEDKKEVVNNRITVFRLLKGCFPYAVYALKDYAKKRHLLPHLDAFLSRLDYWQKTATFELRKEIEKNYLQDVLSWMVDGCQTLGNWQKQRELLERVLAIQEHHYGHDHSATLATRCNMALALKNQGKYEEALQAHQEVLGTEHPNTLTARNNMAGVLSEQGKYEEALQAYKEVYDIGECELGETHLDTLTIQNNMADVLRKQGKYEEALQAFQEVYAKRKELLGALHPNTLSTLNNMAFVLYRQGKYKEALQAFQEVYDQSKDILGASHPNNLKTRTNIAGVLKKQGKYDEALKVYQEVYDISKRELGASHPDTLTMRNNMAGVLSNQEALQAYKEVYEKRKEVLGAVHPDTLAARNNMAFELDRQGKYVEAWQTYQEVYAKIKDLLGPAHPDILTIQNNMAGVLRKQGKYEGALQAYKEVYEKRKGLLGAEHPDTLTTQDGIALILLNQGKHEEALQAFQELLDIRKRVLGSDHPDVVSMKNTLQLLKLETEFQPDYEINDQLFTAVKQGDVQWVRDCIGSGANANARDNNNWTPLHHAAEKGYIEVIYTLLQNRANVNAENNGKATALHFAARNGHIAVVEALLSNEATVNATTHSSNWTPLHFAAKQGHIEVVKVLLQHRASINAQNKASKTALNLAAENNHLALAEVLLNQDHINVSLINEEQRKELINYIIEHHAGHDELLEVIITKLFPNEQPGGD